MDNTDALADSLFSRLSPHINARVDVKSTEREAQLVGTIKLLNQRVDEALQRIAALERATKG